jgi:transposase
MPKPPNEADPEQVATLGDLMAMFKEVLARDEAMWTKLSSRDVKLQEQMIGIFARLADASSVDQVLVNGFDAVAEQIKAQVAPLRSLGRSYEPLKPEADKLLATLQRALRRPDFSLDPAEGGIRTLPDPRTLSDRSITP